MKKWKLVTGVAIVFAVGVLVGSLGAGFYHKYRFDHVRQDPAARRAVILKKFSKGLDLTETQKNEFKKIIDKIEDKKEERFRKGHSEFIRNMDQGFSQMRQVLDPNQQKKLDEFAKKLKEHIKSRGPIGPPPPPPQ
jgi:hypothetical protein